MQILKILKGEEKDETEGNGNGNENSENEENIDDEVYPNSSAELHLSLALLDVNVEDDTTSYGSSTERSNSLPLEEKEHQWSRSSSFD